MSIDVVPTGSKRGKKPTPPGHIKVYKTAIFKIHNPSMHKRAMLLDSMKRAHLAYTRLLATLIPDVERFASMTKKARNAEMQTRIYRFVRPLPLGQATKAGIRIDVQGQINSYIELRQDQEGAQIPTASRLNEESVAYEAALAELASLGSDIERENTLRDDIARLAKSSRLRPVGYYGNTRGFYLFLWNESADRYFVWLNLHSGASRFAKPVTVKDLVDMRTGKLVSFTSQTGAIFPLELGQSFHEVGFIKRGRPQSAKLVHCSQRNGQPCDDFEVHITFEWQTPKREVVHWLGIDRGIYNLAAYAITDELGRAINVGGISGRELRHVQRQEERRIANAQQLGKITRGWARRRAWADEAVHVACNRIVQLAVEHHARVVVEELKNLSAVRRRKRTPGTRRGGFNKLLNRAQYEKLRKVLIYKLGEQGLPEPVPVRPAYTSMTCPECGHVAKENRRKEISADGFALEEFQCIACGYQAHADENAARVIAIKGAWFTGLPTKKERTWTEIPDELKFEAFLKNCAARRKGVQRPQGSYLCAPRPGS
jgi:IS605 OrfB family transposase